MGRQLIGCFLDGRNQLRDILKFVQHRPLPAQGADEPLRVVMRRRPRRLIIQREVLHADVMGDQSRQRGLPRLPRTCHIDDAEIRKQFPDKRLQVPWV